MTFRHLSKTFLTKFGYKTPTLGEGFPKKIPFAVKGRGGWRGAQVLLGVR